MNVTANEQEAELRQILDFTPQLIAVAIFAKGRLVASYLGETDPRNPLASPLYGELTGLPPIRVHVGDDEVLLDDSRRYVARAVAAGVDAELDVFPSTAQHDRALGLTC